MRHLDEGTLQAWLDRSRSGLSAGELEDIERHLSDCDGCVQRMTELLASTRRVRSLLSPTHAPPEPAPDYDAVVARAGRRREGDRRRRMWRGVAWAASVAMALGVGWLSNGLYRDRVTAGVPVAAKPSAAAPSSAAPSVADAEEAAPTRVAESSPTVSEPANIVADAPRSPRPTVGPNVIRGRVTDESGAPLSAAQVVVEGTNIGTLTSRDGTFSLLLGETPGDSAGRGLTLTAQLIGYRPASRVLPRGGAQGDTADFRLAPQVVALNEVVVTGVAAGAREKVVQGASPEIVAAAGDSTWGSAWAVVNRAEAEAALGFTLLLVPDLPVHRIEIGEVGDTPVVRVLQELDGGGRLTLVEASVAVRFAADPAGGGRAWASTRRGEVWVAGTAPTTTEALVALLDRLR